MKKETERSQTMFRIEKDKNNPYVMLNKQFLDNESLSWKAKGILAYLLSLPDDWQIYATELVKHSNDGMASLTSGIEELIKAGHITRKQRRDAGGKFKGYEYRVNEHSHRMRKSENGKSENGKSENGKPLTTNNNFTNNNFKNNDVTEFNGSTSEKMPRDTSVDNFNFNIFNKQIETVMEGISDRGSIGNFAAQDVKEFFEMYYRIGSAMRGIEPIKLKNEQIANVVRAIAYIDKVEYEPDLDDYQMMIRDYFKQKFEDCDYSINHFISGDVMLMRYYNLQKSKV